MAGIRKGRVSLVPVDGRVLAGRVDGDCRMAGHGVMVGIDV